MLSSKIKVSVLRGGPSRGYEDSLKTGGHILSSLREMPETYEPVDIFISKDGEWHREGLVYKPHETLRHADVVWNALHGLYGEDIQVQRVMEGLKIPFVGSSSVASVLALNKDMAKDLYRRHSLLTPAHRVLYHDNFNDEQLIMIFRNYLHPVKVRPANVYGEFGSSIAYTYPELERAVKEAFNHASRAMVEEFIKGEGVSCVVVEMAGGEKVFSFAPVSKSKFKLKPEESREIEDMAKIAHGILGLSHYSNSDFVVTPKRKIYILETDPQPAFHQDSLMHQSVLSTDWHSRDFVDHVLKLAM